MLGYNHILINFNIDDLKELYSLFEKLKRKCKEQDIKFCSILKGRKIIYKKGEYIIFYPVRSSENIVIDYYEADLKYIDVYIFDKNGDLLNDSNIGNVSEMEILVLDIISYLIHLLDNKLKSISIKKKALDEILSSLGAEIRETKEYVIIKFNSKIMG